MGKKARARRKGKQDQGKRAPSGSDASGPRPSAHILDERGSPGRPAELAASLFGLASLLQRRFSRAEPTDGLTRARLSALALLVLGGPRTLGRLAADVGVRPPTMTRLVQAMEVDGLVVREPHPSDGRSIVIRATPAGEAELERGRAARMGHLTRAIGRLSDTDLQTLEQATDLLGPLLRTSDGRGRSDA